jgi:hypothetical protein
MSCSDLLSFSQSPSFFSGEVADGYNDALGTIRPLAQRAFSAIIGGNREPVLLSEKYRNGLEVGRRMKRLREINDKITDLMFDRDQELRKAKRPCVKWFLIHKACDNEDAAKQEALNRKAEKKAMYREALARHEMEQEALRKKGSEQLRKDHGIE